MQNESTSGDENMVKKVNALETQMTVISTEMSFIKKLYAAGLTINTMTFASILIAILKML